jgi:hypothetical protein
MNQVNKIWQGGHLYQTMTGIEVFVPTGTSRRDVPKELGKLRYLGPAMKQTNGWDDDGQLPRPKLL